MTTSPPFAKCDLHPDPMDRLVRRNTTVSDIQTEYFVFDGPDIALKWVDPDGTGGASPAPDRRYLNGPAIDQILAEEEDATDTVSWMIQDRQGSVTDVVNNSGSVIDHIFYDGYGNVLDESAPTTKHTYGYAGYFRDAATGFLGTQTRWYNPAAGRWIQEDWIGFAGGDSNLYRYVGNGPTLFVDPSGKDKLVFAIEGAAGFPKDRKPGDSAPPPEGHNATGAFGTLSQVLNYWYDAAMDAGPDVHWRYYSADDVTAVVDKILELAPKTHNTGTTACYDRIIVLGYSWIVQPLFCK